MPEVLRKVRNWIGHPIQNVKSVVGMIGTRDPKLEEGQSFPAIIVNKDNQTLRYYDADGKEVFKSRVSTGLNPGNKEKEGDQRTSSGTFKITNKANVNPNKFGSTSAYWTNMTNPNGSSAEVGIHGDAGYPDRIGTRASHGCIRMPTANYEALSKYLGKGSGTTVIIRGNKQGGVLIPKNAQGNILKLGTSMFTPTKFQKLFYPHYSKQLAELQQAREFIHTHPYYEYIRNSEIQKELNEAVKEGTNLFRRSGRYNTNIFKDIKEGSDVAAAELAGRNITQPTTWFSKKISYVNPKDTKGSIHIQPETNFSIIEKQNPNKPSGISGYDPASRLVNSSGINLDNGAHYIYIPKAKSYVRMNASNAKSLDLADPEKLNLYDYTTLFPGIMRGYSPKTNKDAWHIAKPYKVAGLFSTLIPITAELSNQMISPGSPLLIKQLLNLSKDKTSEFKAGGNIHIKKSHEGKFTEYCGGKVTEECIQKGKHSPSAKIRKQATFAQNARKWKH